jgi:ferredoxin
MGFNYLYRFMSGATSQWQPILFATPPRSIRTLTLFGESKRDNAMRVVVDLNKCLGYAQCVFLAPTVFKLNGEEALMYDPNPDDATRLKVLRAAAACPVQAILVEHLSDKQREATS